MLDIAFFLDRLVPFCRLVARLVTVVFSADHRAVPPVFAARHGIAPGS